MRFFVTLAMAVFFFGAVGTASASISDDNDGDGYCTAKQEQVDTGIPCDGVYGGEDCDDEDPSTYPDAPEIDDGKDNDCDGVPDEDFDNDGDGYAELEGDCDDWDPDQYPNALEICNGIDEDCDNETDESCRYLPTDADGAGCNSTGSATPGSAAGLALLLSLLGVRMRRLHVRLS